jgi:hypothetical protein
VIRDLYLALLLTAAPFAVGVVLVVIGSTRLRRRREGQ